MPTSPHRALYTVDQVRALEHGALDALAVSNHELMLRAAHAALDTLRRHWPQAARIAIHCGPGNNGGDGFLLGVLARQAGLQVDVVALTESSRGEAAQARAAWRAAGGSVRRWTGAEPLPAVDVHVDAMYGIGFSRAPGAAESALIDAINASATPVLALDLPSGLLADSGDCPGAVIRADVTVTFIAHKRGMHTGRAVDQVGVLELATLGVPESVYAPLRPDALLLAAETLPPRARHANKGDNGHVLVIGGDHGMAGAARLAGEAALRAGAGLVSVATRAEHVFALNAARPELMAHAVGGPQALEPMLERASVLALGPGLGKAAWGHALWLTALDAGKPTVLDADGLNLLAREPRVFSTPTVLTPHPGEAARLLGVAVDDIERDRFSAARELARRHGAVVVLKGAGSLIADPDGRLDVCPWGNPGMASGGMGDLLTGVVAAMLAQGCQPWDAACLAVGLHARAGDLAARQGERGLLASDLLDPLRALGNALPDGAFLHA
jgi:NAD(P)H-hydrate epimerase